MEVLSGLVTEAVELTILAVAFSQGALARLRLGGLPLGTPALGGRPMGRLRAVRCVDSLGCLCTGGVDGLWAACEEWARFCLPTGQPDSTHSCPEGCVGVHVKEEDPHLAQMASTGSEGSRLTRGNSCGKKADAQGRPGTVDLTTEVCCVRALPDVALSICAEALQGERHRRGQLFASRTRRAWQQTRSPPGLKEEAMHKGD